MSSHLQELFEKSSHKKTIEENKLIVSFLEAFQDVFSKDKFDLGLATLTEHSINTGDSPPIKQQPRRVPHALAEEERQAIIELQEKKGIHKSISWSSPLVLVRKKNGKISPCVDHRRLNEITRTHFRYLEFRIVWMLLAERKCSRLSISLPDRRSWHTQYRKTIYSRYGCERFCNRQCFVPSSE